MSGDAASTMLATLCHLEYVNMVTMGDSLNVSAFDNSVDVIMVHFIVNLHQIKISVIL
jgi:hypothetical protein